MAYYYLVASLPPLLLDEAVPFSPEEFYTNCRYLLSTADASDLEYIVNGQPERAAHPLVREWVARDTQLRNAIARIRAARLKHDPDSYTRECSVFYTMIETTATHAMAEDNPLAREQALDRFRWEMLDGLTHSEPFGAFAIHAFVIKLQMAYRWAGLTDDKGKDRLDEIIHRNVQQGIV